MNTDWDNYHFYLQEQEKLSHFYIDKEIYSNYNNEILALPIYLERLGVMGKIDLYTVKEHCLIEREYRLNNIYGDRFISCGYGILDSLKWTMREEKKLLF
ncbi:MAG: hypothetical protein ACTTJH_01275 [Bacteroidales bacterium]